MKKRVFLIGGFNKTKFLATSLTKKGYHVSVINNNMEHCQSLATLDKVEVYHGDGSKPFILEDSNVFGADIVIALTSRDEDNLVICELCKKKFQVKKTVAVISDPKKIEFFYRMGVDSVLCAITAIASIIEQQTLMDKMSMSMPVGPGQIKIVQVSIPINAPAVGKTLSHINLPKEVIVGCVFRGEKSLVPGGDTQILAGDILVLISTEEHEFAAVRELTGR